MKVNSIPTRVLLLGINARKIADDSNENTPHKNGFIYGYNTKPTKLKWRNQHYNDKKYKRNN